MTKTEIKEKYLKLREAYIGMVGSLYPSIAYAELLRLRDAYTGGPGWREGWGDLPPVWPPSPDGTVRPH